MARSVIQIDIDKDGVWVEGQRIKRPSYICPSTWYREWERLKRKADHSE